MRISQFVQFKVTALQNKRRVLAVGPPGVGKTQADYQACAMLGWDCISMCAPLLQPTNIQGYPFRPVNGDGTGDATHALFDGVARAFKATKPTLLLFDDLPMASESVMKAILQLVYEGRIDNRKLPDCVVIGAAGNDVTHGAGVLGMVEPLKGRFHSIVTVEPHIDDTVGFGLANSWPSWLLAFLRNTPDALCDWKPEKSLRQGGANPRGWENVVGWDKIGVDDPEVWEGCVGKGRATQARAFKDLICDLPDVDAILIDPDSAPVPENPSAKYLVSMALADRLSESNFGQVLKYLQRMPAMFRAFSIRDAFRAERQKKDLGKLQKGYKPLSSSDHFTAWVCSEEGKTVLGVAK